VQPYIILIEVEFSFFCYLGSEFYTNDGHKFPRSVGIGIEHVCPTSGKKTYKPDVPVSSTPQVDMYFDSVDDAYEFYNNYAKLGGFTVRKSSQYDHKGVTCIKYLVCSKEGYKNVKKVDTVNEGDGSSSNKSSDRRRRPSKRIGCPAGIQLRLSDNKKYRLHAFTEYHNHTFVDPEDYHLLCSARKLTYIQESLIASLSNLNIGPVKCFNIMRVMCGGFEEVGATSIDCKNFRRDLNVFIGEFDAEMIVRRLMRKKEFLPDFSCEYYTGVEGCLAGLFWADEDMKRNYLMFGDVMSFDATFRTNRLYIFTNLCFMVFK